MSLTRGSAPLSGHPGGQFNFELQAPAHRIYFEDYPRRLRARFGDETVLDTVAAKLLHETGLLPVVYFPEADLAHHLLIPTDHTSHCPFKGDASYWTVEVDGRRAENAMWGYPDPLPEARWLAGYRAFYWNAPDLWLEEDDELHVPHLRDPYTRVDVRHGSDRVTVLAGGEVVAETQRPLLLYETSLPVRWYVPREDVDMDRLAPTDTTTQCPYKGTACYWSVTGGEGMIADAAWAYPEPFPELAAISECISFLGEGIEHRVQRAGTPATVTG